MNEYIDTACPKCGELYLPGDLFCSKCGYEFNLVEKNENEKQYIGKNSQYYSNKFFEMRVVHKDTSWNWAAFLFPAYWCIYRKMYFYGFGLLLLQYVLKFAFLFGNIMNVAIGIAFGVYANHIYMQHVEQLVDKHQVLEEDQKKKHINQYGGVNLVALIAVIVGTFSLAVAAVLLGFEIYSLC
ncbi:zinc-ribbon domain-containing protein [Dethiosulfatibacter aminovorans DSM 17477]|uniref:Zinc-ribbon domain-containing protein n=1 Tax=Dethiosulfatibacter aminovorans DSM 17477 TaxID=1121476 RepID=A0A1M6GA08_9FIRM|nr:zinc-ribbon domain-containing protein [Dethiosulfatibacter aminovorans]SHJ06759.1 zinc-ribbon domain-containing protein [Dethiosulfatibacter aminovorans DSM 17477]